MFVSFINVFTWFCKSPLTREWAQFHNNNSKPEAQVSQKKSQFFKETYCQKHSFTIPDIRIRTNILQTVKWKNTKIYFKTIGGVPSQIWSFARITPCKPIHH